MPAIACSVPALLKECTGGETRFTVEAATLDDAIAALTQTYPLLRLHLYDEQDRLRKHVLLYLNETNVAWLERRDMALSPGDRLSVLQNVSGG